jgi:hypothetical protein
MTSGDDLRLGRLVWGSVWLPMEVSLKRITCRYNNLVDEVLFNESSYLLATSDMFIRSALIFPHSTS